MLYCFVSKDFRTLDPSDPLFLQAEYAKRIGKYCCLDLIQQRIMNANSETMIPCGERILLRSTCDYVEPAIRAILEGGWNLVESMEDVKKIEYWDRLPIVKRRVFPLNCSQILTGVFDSEILTLLTTVQKVFIKSRKKGFSIQVPSLKVLNCDSEFIELIQGLCKNLGADDLLISKCYQMTQDSLGKKEIRCFVLDGVIRNFSRPVHSIKHSVPKSLMLEASSMVRQMEEEKDFPQNYVLDVAEFFDGEVKFLDVVELNPLTSSLCYVNNSIFSDPVNDVLGIYGQFKAGFEYCYDYLKNPHRYVFTRCSGDNYEYINTEQYILQ